MDSFYVARKAFINDLSSGPSSRYPRVWVQGVASIIHKSPGGIQNFFLDDGTGILSCVPKPETHAPQEIDLLVGKYVQAVGALESPVSDSGDKRMHLILCKYFVIDDPNMESLWITEVLQQRNEMS